MSIAYPHIVHPADGGEPVIDGSRIRVRDIVAARDDGQTPEGIVNDTYPDLSLGQVYAALAYFEDHREEIAEDERREVEVMEEFKSRHPGSLIDRR